MGGGLSGTSRLPRVFFLLFIEPVMNKCLMLTGANNTQLCILWLGSHKVLALQHSFQGGFLAEGIVSQVHWDHRKQLQH